MDFYILYAFHCMTPKDQVNIVENANNLVTNSISQFTYLLFVWDPQCRTVVFLYPFQ